MNKEIIDFNADQICHIQTVQQLVLQFCHDLAQRAITHDASKFSADEYEGFIASRESLRGSVDGRDAAYQKNLSSVPIQKHITTNAHHPEYWDAIGKPMPIAEIILMFFDWTSRCMAKGGTMKGFWEFNLDKLRKNQAHAIPTVEALLRSLPNEISGLP